MRCYCRLSVPHMSVVFGKKIVGRQCPRDTELGGMPWGVTSPLHLGAYFSYSSNSFYFGVCRLKWSLINIVKKCAWPGILFREKSVAVASVLVPQAENSFVCKQVRYLAKNWGQTALKNCKEIKPEFHRNPAGVKISFQFSAVPARIGRGHFILP